MRGVICVVPGQISKSSSNQPSLLPPALLHVPRHDDDDALPRPPSVGVCRHLLPEWSRLAVLPIPVYHFHPEFDEAVAMIVER